MLFEIIKNNNPLFFKIANNPEEREILINARKSAYPAISRLGPTSCAEDCTINITEFSKAVKKFEALTKTLNIPNILCALVCHMEVNLHPVFVFNENDPKDRTDFEKALNYLYKEIIIPLGGAVTGEHGIGKVKTPYLVLEHGPEVVDLMSQIKKIFDPNMILNPGNGKGDIRPLPKSDLRRQLINSPNKLLEFNCIRCGFCTVTCPSKLYYKSEAYSPRGRLSLLYGIVYGDVKFQNYDLINKIVHTCTLCGLCLTKCPAGVQIHEIFEKAREIMHKNS